MTNILLLASPLLGFGCYPSVGQVNPSLFPSPRHPKEHTKNPGPPVGSKIFEACGSTSFSLSVLRTQARKKYCQCSVFTRGKFASPISPSFTIINNQHHHPPSSPPNRQDGKFHANGEPTLEYRLLAASDTASRPFCSRCRDDVWRDGERNLCLQTISRRTHGPMSRSVFSWLIVVLLSLQSATARISRMKFVAHGTRAVAIRRLSFGPHLWPIRRHIRSQPVRQGRPTRQTDTRAYDVWISTLVTRLERLRKTQAEASIPEKSFDYVI